MLAALANRRPGTGLVRTYRTVREAGWCILVWIDKNCRGTTMTGHQQSLSEQHWVCSRLLGGPLRGADLAEILDYECSVGN